MRKLALAISALLVLLAALLVSPLGALAAGSIGGPDRPGPDRHARTQAHRLTPAPSLPALTCDGTFHAVASANNSISSTNILEGTAAISANDVWAVGIGTGGPSFPFETLAEHWDGSAWTIASTQNPGAFQNYLFGVAAVSSNDVWAVGALQSNVQGTVDHTIAERWDGSTWSVFPTPNGPGGASSDLFAVSAVASNDVWAVGQFIASSKNNTLVEHWNGSSWKIVPSPDAGTSNNQLFGVSAFNSADVWAVGYYRPVNFAAHRSLAEHWNGAAWTVVASSSQASDTEMDAVTALASGTAVGVGFARTSLVAPTLPFQFGLSSGGGVGGNFFIAVPGTSDNDLLGVTVASGKVWAVGWSSQNLASPAQTLVVSADYTSGFLGQLVGGSGDNLSAGSNNLLFAVTAVSRNDFWAAGYSDFTGVPQTLTELNCRRQLTLTAPASTVASTAFGLTVTAADMGGATLTGYLGTVHFTSSDPQAVLPADYTFVPGDSGTHNFAGVVLNTPGIQTITASDTVAPFLPGSATIRVLCRGACPAPAGTPGNRGANQGPAGTPGTRGANQSGAGAPGPRLPRLRTLAQNSVSAPGLGLATAKGPAPNIGGAAPAAGSTPSRSARPPGGAAGNGTIGTSLPAPTQYALSLVARRERVSTPPDQTTWYVLLLICLLVCPLTLVEVRRRTFKEKSNARIQP